MKNKTVKALATLLAITTVSMMGTAGVMASDNTAEDTATEAAADTEEAATDTTDEDCKAAKEAWDALTDAQKELVEGEEASPEYFGRDTGDASKDDPRNQDEIGENELLVVSFGTSFNDSRAQDTCIYSTDYHQPCRSKRR